MTTMSLKSAWSAVRSRFSARQQQIDLVHELYGAIVAQARQPVFYQDLGVPDVLDGRFDLIVLHLSAATRRLAELGAEAKETEQGLMGLFFADMDRSLREMGVGDLSVGKKIRNMAEAYYGRSQAYGEALGTEDDRLLEEAIGRNVYGGDSAADEALGRMAHYQRALGKGIDQWDGSLDGLQAVFGRAMGALSTADG